MAITITWEQEAAEEHSLYRSVQEWNMFPEQAAELLEHVFVPEGLHDGSLA